MIRHISLLFTAILFITGFDIYCAGLKRDTVEFVYSLHGQTRRYEVFFLNASDSLSMNWKILRNNKWESGEFIITPEAIANATSLSFLQPVNYQSVVLPPDQTVGILSASAFNELKAKQSFTYNNIKFKCIAVAGDSYEVKDVNSDFRMKIDYSFGIPLIVNVDNNPLGINWKVNIPQKRLSVREEIMCDINKSGSVYYAYPEPISELTPPPYGFKPVYISHYGRHGSRWVTDDNRYENTIRLFNSQELTPLGIEVREKLAVIYEDARGRAGDLTPIGVRQHKQIAERMYNNYSELFEECKSVCARSSTVNRCIMSMTAFCERLKELNPALDISKEASKRYMDYIAYDTKEIKEFSSESAPWRGMFRSYEHQNFNPDRLISSLFVNPDNISNKQDVMKWLYWIASSIQNTVLDTDLQYIFLKEELYGIWKSINYRMYLCNGPAPLNEGKAGGSAVSLLENIIESADKAIENKDNTVTLRFGHDSNLIRLLTLMNIEGCTGKESDPEKFCDAWQDYRISPMGANLQLIFFRKADEVIVKILHNEKEVSVPVRSETAPYYQWYQLREYWHSCIAENQYISD